MECEIANTRLFANKLSEARGRRINDDDDDEEEEEKEEKVLRLSDHTYPKRLANDGCQEKRERERETGARSQFNLPRRDSGFCLAVIISGVSVNVFRAYLSSVSPFSRAERTADTRSIGDAAHVRQIHAHTTMTSSRSSVRGRRSIGKPAAGAVPEIISLTAKRERELHRDRRSARPSEVSAVRFERIAFSSDTSKIFPHHPRPLFRTTRTDWSRFSRTRDYARIACNAICRSLRRALVNNSEGPRGREPSPWSRGER